ncbi:MAG: hypothetical protein JJD97_05570 [Gemmatimonadaceae bacterium]|nr:hypothetical protein [Gemmatimonadaceae bacterium]
MKCNVPARPAKGLARAQRSLKRAIVASMVAALALSTAGACASGHVRRDGGEQPMIVHLTNNLVPPSDVTVYVVTQQGVRELLGSVPPNKDRALTIRGSMLRGTSFRIVAERALGRSVVSQPINASNDGSIIDWELQTNAVWFPESAP